MKIVGTVYDAVKRSGTYVVDHSKSVAVGVGTTAVSAVAHAETILPAPVTAMFATITDYVNMTFALALPVIALSIGLGILITLSKRFSKKV